MKLRTTIRRLGCQLNLSHKWAGFHTEDGLRYERCVRCGKDQGIRGMPYQGQKDWADNG
jgi:hypothetical protein